MVSRRNQTLLSLSIFLGVLAWNVAAAAVKGETASVPVGQLSVHEIEEQLQVGCSFSHILAGLCCNGGCNSWSSIDVARGKPWETVGNDLGSATMSRVQPLTNSHRNAHLYKLSTSTRLLPTPPRRP